MRIQHLPVLAVMLALQVFAAEDSCLLLGLPIWKGNQVQFSLAGEPGVAYVLEFSADLEHWVSVLTNNDAAFTRMVTLNTPGPSGFFRASRGPLPLFGAGLVVQQGITANGNDFYFDAYDSADALHFPGGVWNSTNAFAGGDVAIAPGGTVDLLNAVLHGRLILASGAGYTIGTNAMVGDMPWNWPAQSGIEPPVNDWVITILADSCFALMFGSPDVIAPYSSGLAFPAPVNDSYLLNTGNYLVSGNFTLNHNLLVQGRAMTSFTLSGNNEYMGLLYAPECDVILNGGSNNAIDYQGAITARSISLNSHFDFHYDWNLKRVGPVR